MAWRTLPLTLVNAILGNCTQEEWNQSLQSSHCIMTPLTPLRQMQKASPSATSRLFVAFTALRARMLFISRSSASLNSATTATESMLSVNFSENGSSSVCLRFALELVICARGDRASMSVTGEFLRRKMREVFSFQASASCT